MTATSPRHRLASGWHLFRVPDGGWRLATPQGTYLRIAGDEHVLDACSRGRRILGDAALYEGLLARGALAAADASPATGRLRVHISGDDPVARAAIDLLTGQVDVVTGHLDEGAVGRCDALLVSALRLTDTRFRQVDDWCRMSGTAWTTCFPEGSCFVLGPAGRPGVSASYRDVRGRRLAAAPLPVELAALWAHLDSDDEQTEVLRPEPQVATVLAGLAVHDLLAAARGRPLGRQLVVDPASLEIVSHPVLALPRGIAAASITGATS